MKISCFMVTTESRRWCIPLAIRCFQNQIIGHPEDLELVVASEHDVSDLIPPDDPRIRFEPTPEGISLGTKHNAAVERCSHGWLAKWDDDDWHAPRRLAVTVGALQRTGAMIAGASSLVFHELFGRSYRYRYAGNDPWVSGNALVFHRSVWDKVKFPDRASGVDTVWAFEATKKHPVVEVEGLVVVLHHGQTTGRKTWPPTDKAFSLLPTNVINEIMGDELALYERAFKKREKAK